MAVMVGPWSTPDPVEERGHGRPERAKDALRWFLLCACDDLCDSLFFSNSSHVSLHNWCWSSLGWEIHQPCVSSGADVVVVVVVVVVLVVVVVVVVVMVAIIIVVLITIATS